MSVLFRCSNGVLTEYVAEKGLVKLEVPTGLREIGARAFGWKKDIVAITIPDSVKHISTEAFLGCTNLRSLTLMSGLEYIDDYVFADCVNLQTVYIPESVKYIGASAFAGCTSLKYIYVAEGNSRYISKAGVLYSKDMVELTAYPNMLNSTYTIPEGVLTINSGAFSHCINLQNIQIADSVQYIEKNVFMGCSALEILNIPKTVKHLGENCLSDCANLNKLTLYLFGKPVTLRLGVGYGTSYTDKVMLLKMYNAQNKASEQDIQDMYLKLTQESVKYPILLFLIENCKDSKIKDIYLKEFKRINNLIYNYYLHLDDRTTLDYIKALRKDISLSKKVKV